MDLTGREEVTAVLKGVRRRGSSKKAFGSLFWGHLYTKPILTRRGGRGEGGFRPWSTQEGEIKVPIEGVWKGCSMDVKE